MCSKPRNLPPPSLSSHLKAALLTLLLTLCYPSWLQAITLAADEPAITITPQVGFLADPDHTLTIDDVAAAAFQGQFLRYDSDTVRMGRSGHSYWLRITVENHAAPEEWLLVNEHLWNYRLDLYRPAANGWQLEHNGILLPFNQRVVAERKIVFALQVPQGESRTYYLHSRSLNQSFTLSLQRPQHYFQAQRGEATLQLLLAGAIVAMILYNAILTVTLRSRLYLYYIGYLSSTLFFFLTQNGLAMQYLWPQLPLWNRVADSFFMALSGIIMFLFANAFLRLGERLPGHRRLLLGVVVANTAVVAGFVLTTTPLAARWLHYTSLSLALVLLVTAVRVARLGHREALLFLTGYVIFLGAGMLKALHDIQVLNLPLATELMQLGFAIEAMLFAYALVLQIRFYKDRATRDRLTRVYNRHRFDEVFAERFIATRRTGSPLYLLLFDIDHFKHINDNHGHLVGDQVLIRLVQVIERELGRSAFFARWGGEEFVALVEGRSPAEVTALAERIRLAIERTNFPEVGHVTTSTGIAARLPDDSPDTLVARADQALYRAKEGGRNRCVLAEVIAATA